MLSVELLRVSRRLVELGLNRGTSGSCSALLSDDASGHEARFLITPSGVGVETMFQDSMVEMTMDGEVCQPEKPYQPSSEWRFHRDIYRTRPEIGAVVHVHSPYATALSCLRRELPPFHYMIAVSGGENIRCAPYALFGTQALSDAVLEALQGRTACLLANHGMIATGRGLKHALALALEVESLCEHYQHAAQLGEPVLLNADEMAAAIERFKGYGQHG